MRLGVFSDSHGNLTALRQAAVACIEKYKVDAIIHLGDDSTDAEGLANLGVDLIWIPGIFEDRYKVEEIPNRLIREFGDVPFLITHTVTRDSHDLPDDIDPTAAVRDGDVRVVLYGHTHKYRAQMEHGAVFINPGHLKPDDKCGNPPTFAVIEVVPEKLHVIIVGLDGKIFEDKKFFLEASVIS